MMAQSSSQLPIDECEEWIWDILDCTKDCGFEYISGDSKEFLILIQMISMQIQERYTRLRDLRG